MGTFNLFFLVLLFFGLLIISNAVRVLREYERGVVFRLGRLVGEKGPGLIFLIPLIVYFRVVNAPRAIVEVESYLFATSQLSQTTLRSILGQSELDDLLAERDKINQRLQTIIDEHTGPWGIKVSNVEVKQIDLPPEMQRAMARQAEAERERRAKVVHAEGELQASAKLYEASNVLGSNPIALQLRYLQTLTEVASDKSSTILFPFPMDLLKPFIEKK
jgi:regulator of protease activity HflC (stomatin/prohibitin superfamily)